MTVDLNRRAGGLLDPKYTIFCDTMVATAILDRLLHHSTVVMLRGESYRLMEKRRSGLLRKEETSPAAAG